MILGDLIDAGYAEIRTGPFGTQLRASDYVAVGRPVLNVRNVGLGDVRPEKFEFVDEATAQRLAGHILEDGDIVFGRKGAVERHAFIRSAYVGALQGSDCIRLRFAPTAPIKPGFATFALRTSAHQSWMQSYCSHGATMASLNQEILRQIEFPELGLPEQAAVVRVLQSIDDLIENNRRRIDVLEQMAHAVYREWFVRFRYPGHDHATIVDSPLGPIPEGWSVRSVASIAASQRNAVTGGPFGSKLGTRDYLPSGVPVLRGGNLKLGGGFDETEVVFVSKEKAQELSGCAAARGDVVITQRGTLGQVGMIPEWSRFTRYVLSQSQMKVTVDQDQITPEYFYAQFRSPEATGRFVAQAMSSGVPHVNLALLREFEFVLPSLPLQVDFSSIVRPLAMEQGLLQCLTDQLSTLRDMLLPKLVSGQIDVSGLDLDLLLETVA